MNDDHALREFEAHLTTMGMEGPTLQLPPQGTLRPGRKPSAVIAAQALRTLPELRISEEGDLQTIGRSDLVALRTLGEGGMGLVRLATQVAMNREVAVKTSHESANDWSKQILLQEAYITGYLEHPNIIPIYTVGKTGRGEPLIVMKRVEGVSWRALLYDEAHKERRDSLSLADHLEILLQVCDALRFAHSKRIIHRDIKLENVMIGNYNEVYLLDWGIALSLQEEHPQFPTRKHAKGLSGTPNYMAPEMAHQEIDTLDERTDVYLLGATLHHLLIGRPRHEGEKVLHVLFRAAQSEPFDYPSEVPEELGRIVNKACAPAQEDRFASVLDFQKALRGYLEHRQSNELVEKATEKLPLLSERAKAKDRDLFALHDLYGECRFAYREALRLWPENQIALQGLQQCLLTMGEHYLRTDNLEGAMACLAEMPSPPAHFQEGVETLQEQHSEKEARFKRLQRMAEATDLNSNPKARSLFALFLAILWGITTTLAALSSSQPDITHQELLNSHLITGIRNLAIVSVSLLLFRRFFFVNAVNKSIFAILWVVIFLVGFMRWTAWMHEIDMVMAHAADLSLYALALFAVGLLSDKRLSMISGLFGLAAIFGVVVPTYQVHFEAISTVLTFTAISWIWWPRES